MIRLAPPLPEVGNGALEATAEGVRHERVGLPLRSGRALSTRFESALRSRDEGLHPCRAFRFQQPGEEHRPRLGGKRGQGRSGNTGRAQTSRAMT